MNNILSVFIEQWEIFDEQLKTRASASVEYENKTYADVDELCIDLGLSNDEAKQCKIVFVYTNSIEKALNKQSRENFINKKAEEYEYGKSLPSMILKDEAFIDDYYKLDNNIRHMLYGHIYTDFDEDKAIRYCIGALYAEINREDLVNIFGEYVVEEAEYDIIRESISDEDYEIYHTIFNATCRLQDILKLDNYDVYAIGRLFVDSEEIDYEVRSSRIKLCKDYVSTIKHKTVDLEDRLRALYTDEIVEIAYEQAIGSCGYRKELLNEVSAKLKDAISNKVFVLDIGFSDKELQALNTAITINILKDWNTEELYNYIRNNLQLVYAENKKDISKVRHILGYILDSYEVTKIENEITLSIKNYGRGWVKVLKTDLGIHLTTDNQNTDKPTSETEMIFSGEEDKQKKENSKDLKDSTKSFIQMLKKSKIYDPNTGKIKAYNRILTFYNKADKGKLLRVEPEFIADMLNNTNWKADNVGIFRHIIDEEIFFRLNYDNEDICINRYFRYLSDFSNNRKKILLAILPIIYGYSISDKVIRAYRSAASSKGKMLNTLKITPNIPDGNKELIEKYLDTKGYESLRFAVNGSASYEGIISLIKENSFMKISHKDKFELHELLSSLSRQELLPILRDLEHYKYLATDLSGVKVILGRAMVRYKIFDVDTLSKDLTFGELGEYLLCLLYYAKVVGSADIQVPTEN